MQQNGYPAYTTSAGWIGYSDDKIRHLCGKALAQGWTHFKLKVGGDPADDLRRAHLVRAEIGSGNKLMMDANQKWDVLEAIQRTKELAELDLWWMEEPTSPDDILGHARIRQEVSPIRIATGEHCHNRVMFKQFLQAGAIDVVAGLDNCRLAGESTKTLPCFSWRQSLMFQSVLTPGVSVYANACSTWRPLITFGYPRRWRIVQRNL